MNKIANNFFIQFLILYSNMDSLIVFSKILNIPIKDNKLIIPDNFDIFKLPPNIRSIIYTYFHLVSKHIEGLNWAKIGKIMNEDTEISYIDSVDPAIYYDNNIVLSKLHIQDYNLIKNGIKKVKIALNYETLGWNVNFYFNEKMLTLEEISKIKHTDEVLNKKIIEINPNLFDMDVLFKRFNLQLNLTNYQQNNADRYRLKCLDRYSNINYDDIKWYSDNKYVLRKILENNPKTLNPIFEQCVLNSGSKKEISELYLNWFSKNRNSKYCFDLLLQECKNIDILFENGVNLPFTAIEQFNYNRKYINYTDCLKIMPSFNNRIWNYFKNDDLIEILPKYNIYFKYLSKKECINFYNIFYKPSLEFYQIVFENKLLRVDDVERLEQINYKQAKYILKYWNEKRGKSERLYEIIKQKLNIVEIYKLSIKGLIKTKYLKLSNQKYNKKDHEIVIKFILQNNIIITDHIDNELIKNPKLLQNISWKIINNQIKFNDLFEYFIDNDIKLDYNENIKTIQQYIHTIPEYMIQKLSDEKIIELIVNPLKNIEPQSEKSDNSINLVSKNENELKNNKLIHDEDIKHSITNINSTLVNIDRMPKSKCETEKSKCEMPKSKCEIPKSKCEMPKSECKIQKAVEYKCYSKKIKIDITDSDDSDEFDDISEFSESDD